MCGEETKKLTAEINQVLEKYLPEAGDLAIKLDDKELKPPEKIWQEIIDDE